MGSQTMSLSIEGIAGFSGRRPWWTILGWVLVLVAAMALIATQCETALDGDGGPTQTLEYQEAADLIDERFGSLDPEPEPGEGEQVIETQTEFIIVS